MFNSNNFGEISFLSFDQNFNVEVNNQSKIILGPNGVCKTKIYRSVKERHPEYSYIDYEDLRTSTIKKKNKLSIGSSIKLIEEKIRIKNEKIESVNIKKNFSEVGITKKGDATSISEIVGNCYDNYELAILSFEQNNINVINSLSEENKRFLTQNLFDISTMVSVENELNKIKDTYRLHMFEKVESILSNEDIVCPICDTVKDITIKTIIADKKSQLSTVQDNLIKKYMIQNSILKPEEIVVNLSTIKNLVSDNSITEQNVASYLICGSDETKITQIINIKSEIIQLNNEISILEVERNEFYNNLTNCKESITYNFSKYFGVLDDKISFDDTNKCVNITLPRNVDTYSTGEINLMVFILNIYEFIGSNKDYLIVDDPLTSYDIANQYRIIYELVSSISINKKILVFTHNIDTINIANTQHRGVFKYQNIEKINNILYINDINVNGVDSLLNINNLLNNIIGTDMRKGYLKLLSEKDNLDLNDPMHLIFHYDESHSEVYGTYNLNNDYLSDLIDNFSNTSFSNINFIDNAINKIIYISAIRVWIEKQFFLIHPNDDNLKGVELGRKINYLFPKDAPAIWNGLVLV